VRILSGVPVAPDPTPWTDVVLPPTPDPAKGGAIDARGFETVWFDVEFTGGSGNAVSLALVVRDEGAPDGQRWKHLLLGGAPQILKLDGTGFVEARVEGRVVFPCLVAVQGGPSVVTILAIPGARMREGASV
jgi:hypothetical protein